MLGCMDPRGLWSTQVVPRLTDLSLGTAAVGGCAPGSAPGSAAGCSRSASAAASTCRHQPHEVTAVDAVEPSEVAWVRSADRRGGGRRAGRRVGLDGQRLEADDATYDAALATFTLCTIPDVGKPHWRRYAACCGPGPPSTSSSTDWPPTPAWSAGSTGSTPSSSGWWAAVTSTATSRDCSEPPASTVTALRAEYLPGPRVGRPWTYVFLGTAVRRE